MSSIERRENRPVSALRFVPCGLRWRDAARARGRAWPSRAEHADELRRGGRDHFLGQRLGAGPAWHGRKVSRILRAVLRGAPGNGSTVEVGPGGWFLGWRSRSAAASSPISPSTGSRRRGRRPGCSPRLIVAAILLRTGRLRFPLRSGLRPSLPALRPRRSSARSSPIRCCRRRCGTSTSRASSRRAKSASAPTASSVRVERIAGPRLERAARARAGFGAQGHGAGGRQLRRVQGAAVAAARTVAAGRLRLCARHVFPADRRLRFRARSHPHRRGAARAEPVAALCHRDRRHARGDRQAHPCGPARRQGRRSLRP